MKKRRLSDNQLHLLLVFAPIVICILTIVVIESMDDPRTIAASRDHPELAFTPLADTQRVYRMHNRETRKYYFFTLARYAGEVLTEPVRVTPCESSISAWIPRYPKAQHDACMTLRSNAGERRSWSFVVKLEDTIATREFYKSALASVEGGMSELLNGTFPVSNPVLLNVNAIVGFDGGDGSRRLTMDYYRISPSEETVVIVEY